MASEQRPRVVVLGGGTGMPVLLRGLKELPIELTALVAVSDNGGSTGRLRNEMGMPAPGDIRNVIAALSDAEPMLLDLFQHRFRFSEASGYDLSGHTMGNLLLAAMTSLTGDFLEGIQEISRVLNVKGNILPISNESVSLHAKMTDGTIVSGESQIPRSHKEIDHIYLSPKPVKPLPDAVSSLMNADLVVIAPGSLYTSILPNLIMPQIDEALDQTKANVVYICNVMTQSGETDNYSAADHVQAIRNHTNENCIDSVVVHNGIIHEGMRSIYAEEDASPVIYDDKRLCNMGLRVIDSDIIDPEKPALRHDAKKVADLLYSLIE